MLLFEAGKLPPQPRLAEEVGAARAAHRGDGAPDAVPGRILGRVGSYFGNLDFPRLLIFSGAEHDVSDSGRFRPG